MTFARTSRAASSATLALLLLSALAAWSGVQLAPSARAASADSVTATATIGSSLSLIDTCSATMGISVTLAGYSSDDCGFSFGSTNDTTTFLRVNSSAGAFFSGAVFPDHIGSCTALSVDSAGYKVSAVGTGVTNSLGCTVSATGTNADFSPVPDSFTNACAATVAVINNTCTIAVGIREVGGDGTSGSYTATLDVDVAA